MHNSRQSSREKRTGMPAVSRKPKARTSNSPASANAAALQRAVTDPAKARPADILSLQKAYGNQAVQRLLRKPALGAEGGPLDATLEQAIQNTRGGGRSLDGATGDRMSAALGADVSGVKVHTDAKSDALNRSLSAKAFTTGSDIFFSKGAYQPNTYGGQKLIAHELTHVVQQGGTKPSGIQTKLRVGPARDRYEQEAERVAGTVAGGAAAQRSPHLKPNRAHAPKLSAKGIQRFSIEDAHPSFGDATSITASLSGASGVYFFHEGAEFTPQTLVVKPSNDPVPETMTMQALQGKAGGGAVPKTVNGTAHKGEIKDALEHNMNWTKAYAKKVERMNAEGDKFNSDDEYVGTKEKFKRSKLNDFDAAPTVYLMGLVQGEEFKDTAKTDTNRAKELLSDQTYMTNLGKATAVDIFLGNGDRLLSGNLGNWMSDAQNNLHLIDNIDQTSINEFRNKLNSGITAKEFWKEQYQKLSDGNIEATGIASVRALLRTLHLDSQGAGWGQFISVQQRPAKTNPNNMVQKKYGEISKSDLSEAERFLLKPIVSGLKAGKKKILSSLAPKFGKRSRSLKRETVGQAGDQSWEDLKDRARWLNSV